MLFAHAARTAWGRGRGQGLVEYALIIVLVGIVVIAALFLLGPMVGNAFSTVNNSLSSI